MAETRLRKAFQYKDDESDDEPLALDEQEQEELITELKKQNETSNSLFLKLFAAIPVLSIAVFVASLSSTNSSIIRLICMLAMSSIVANVYTLLSIPTSRNGRTLLNQLEVVKLRVRFPRVPLHLSPLQKHLPILNMILSLLIGLWGLATRKGPNASENFWVLCWLPLIELAMVQSVRKWILDVDPEDLDRLRYDYRGA